MNRCTSYEEILHRTPLDIASPRIEGILATFHQVEGGGFEGFSDPPQRFTRSLGVPAIFPGSNTFFFARIPDTRYIFHRVLPRSFSRGRKEGLLTQEVRTNQSFATADPHKFFHADSLATEHATESWITMSGITFRLLLPPPPPPRAPRFYNYWFPSSFDAI